MAAGPFVFYCKNLNVLKLLDLAGATLKLALVGSGYTPDIDSSTGHTQWSDASGDEIASGFGYSTGGVTLSSPTITAITGGYKLSTGDASWTASGGSIPAWRYGVLYVSGSLWGITNPLLGYHLGDTTPADVPATLDGYPLTIYCPTPNGWLTLVKP